MGDLFDDLYARRQSGAYGSDIDAEDTGDALPEHHGYRHHLATGCRCSLCVAGCEARQQWARS